MNDADFITVFDAGAMGYRDWWMPACGLIFILVVILRPKLIDAGKVVEQPLKRPWLTKFVLVFAIFWTGIAFFTTDNDQIKSREDLLSGHAAYIEGEVQNFVPMPYMGHAEESFTVKGVHFPYSDYVVTPSFHNTTSHGGPIREGLYVRIWYSGNDILKLQLPKNGALNLLSPVQSTPKK